MWLVTTNRSLLVDVYGRQLYTTTNPKQIDKDTRIVSLSISETNPCLLFSRWEGLCFGHIFQLAPALPGNNYRYVVSSTLMMAATALFSLIRSKQWGP